MKSVFVNVFGGITSCDAVANGIVSAFKLLESRGEAVTRRWSSGLTATTPSSGGRSWTDAALPRRRAGRHHGRRGQAGRRARLR